jgi:phospholipase/carboxylesterase
MASLETEAASPAALVYRETPSLARGNSGTLIALHGNGGDSHQLQPLLRRLNLPLTAIAPQAPRTLNPHGYLHGDRGFAWYFAHSIGHPEAATFGDCLWQLEQFIYDIHEREGGAGPLFLLGYDQGAVLAVTIAGLVPEYLCGVAVIAGYLPKIQGCPCSPRHMHALPLLFIHDPDSVESPAQLVRESAGLFAERAGSVELVEIAGAHQNPLSAADPLQSWFYRTLCEGSVTSCTLSASRADRF